MACPTCGHEMKLLAETQLSKVYYCFRCGTVQRHLLGIVEQIDAHVPALVGRCREFQDQLDFHFDSWGPEAEGVWKHLGIHEAINLPANRPS